MHMGKRLLSAMLAMVVAVGLCPTAALAAQGGGERLVAQTSSVLTTQSAIDESEPNDDFDHADVIKMNVPVYGESSDGWSDEDYFKVVLPASGSVKITFTNGKHHDNGYFYTEIYDQYYQEVGHRDWSSVYYTKPESNTFSLKKGVNYIKVFCDSGYDNHPYHFKLTYNIPTTSLKVTAEKKAFTAKWTKKLGAIKYQLRYAKNKSMSKAKTVNISKKGSSKKIKKLKAKKKYWVQVRVVKKIGGQTYYSPWSTKRAVTTKK